MIIQNIGSIGLAATSDVSAAKAASSAPIVSPQQTSTSPQQLRAAVDTLNQAMQDSNQNLEFSIDSETKSPVVKVVDTQTGDLVMQFPSKAALAVAHSIDQYQRGLLLNQKA
jgi:flagellar protein FlaG